MAKRLGRISDTVTTVWQIIFHWHHSHLWALEGRQECQVLVITTLRKRNVNVERKYKEKNKVGIIEANISLLEHLDIFRKLACCFWEGVFSLACRNLWGSYSWVWKTLSNHKDSRKLPEGAPHQRRSQSIISVFNNLTGFRTLRAKKVLDRIPPTG